MSRDSDIAVGGLLIAPGKSLTIGTRGNRNEHSGIWYELESYYMYYIPDLLLPPLRPCRHRWMPTSWRC